MLKLLASLLFVTCLGIAQADHHLIAAGCDTDKTCFQFAGCSLTTSPTSPNLATIYTTGNDTVEFQLQFDNSNAGWMAIGLSNTQNMPDTWVFMCVRPDSSNVNVQERFASARSRPPIVTSFLTTVSTSNDGSLFNCTFTSPVSRTPMLNNINGYYVLLAWGQYTGGNIQQHSGTGRCVTSNRMTITTASGITSMTTTSGTTTGPTTQPTTSVTPPTDNSLLIILFKLLLSLFYQGLCFLFRLFCGYVV